VYDVVKVGIATKEGDDEELELVSVPIICQPLTFQPIDLCVKKYQHLSDLELADSTQNDVPMEVDLLTGSNYYWSFATGEICRGEEGPVSICTKFGWILSGAGPTSVVEIHLDPEKIGRETIWVSKQAHFFTH